MSSPSLTRYNGYSAVEIVGSPAPGHASGEAMNEMQKIVESDLPRGFGYDWTGQSYQERSEEHTSELQSLMRISYAVFCLKKKNKQKSKHKYDNTDQITH